MASDRGPVREYLAWTKYRAWWATRHLNRLPAEGRLRRHLTESSPPWNVHVGAGRNELSGWLNTDVSPRCRYWLDVRHPWPFPKGSVGMVFSDNVIEHLSLTDGRAFLRNARESMAPGGVIRTSTPDALGFVHAYLDYPDKHLDAMRAKGWQAEHPVDLIRTTFSLWGHHSGYVYDEQALTAELVRAGFSSVKRVNLGESDRVELQGIDRPPADTDFYFVLEAET
jgi:predicted SAM-dependent methyltransferase